MKINRRSFLYHAGALTATSLLFPYCSGRNEKQPPTGTITPLDRAEGVKVAGNLDPSVIGLQLYTVRDQLENDMHRTLEQIAAIGYKEVESAMGIKGHYYGMKPKDFAGLLQDKGLRLVSSHGLLGQQLPKELRLPPHALTFTYQMEKLVDLAAETGQKYLVCAYMFPSERVRLDQYKRWIEIFNRAGEACKKAGLQFAYHNHDFEFEKLEGQVPYDLILAQTDPELVKMELDLYWVEKAGVDPLALFQQHPGRFPLWHIKDMSKTPEKTFAEVGTGSINFREIFRHGEAAGVKHIFVEQDLSDNPLESIETSYKNLTGILS